MRTLLAVLLAVSTSTWAAVEDELQLGKVKARVEQGATVYLALEAGGVVVVDTSTTPPRVVRRLGEGRVFDRLLLDGSSLVALEVRREAVVFPLEGPAAATPAAPPMVVTPPPSEGPAPAVAPLPTPVSTAKVTGVRDGRVMFDGGTATGFMKGTRVRIIAQRLEKKPDLTTGEPVLAPSGAVTGVLEIEDAQAGRAMAVLGRGDTAEVGDLVELTSLPLSERLLAPRRAPFQFRTGFVVRPFLGLEGTSKPVGLMADAFFQWYLPQAPVVISVTGAPLGVVFNGFEPHYPGVLVATAAYTTDYFEIGLGVGALYGNPGPCGFPLGACEVNTGFTINQVLRLGALDGLNLEWHSSIFMRPQQFVFGVGRGSINVPLSSRLGLFGAGGGGENGWAFGEFGVRTAVGGAGGRGTMILSASLGVSAIFDGPSREMILGPAVSFGSEWRL